MDVSEENTRLREENARLKDECDQACRVWYERLLCIEKLEVELNAVNRLTIENGKECSRQRQRAEEAEKLLEGCEQAITQTVSGLGTEPDELYWIGWGAACELRDVLNDLRARKEGK